MPVEETNDLSTSNLRDLMAYERSEGMGPNRRNPGIWAHQLASTKMDSFVIVLLSEQFWPLKWAFCVCSSPARKKKPPGRSRDPAGHAGKKFIDRKTLVLLDPGPLATLFQGPKPSVVALSGPRWFCQFCWCSILVSFLFVVPIHMGFS